MSKQGRSGLVIPVPEADELLSSVAEEYPSAVREGVPAHVSVLYPFVPVAEIDDSAIETLTGLFRARPPLSVRFGSCHREEGFVFLRPEPVDGVAELTAGARRHWPEVVPYEGAHGAVEPHLTVTMKQSSDTAAAIERDTAEWLPIAAELREAWLVTFTDRWDLHTRFPFGEAA